MQIVVLTLWHSRLCHPTSLPVLLAEYYTTFRRCWFDQQHHQDESQLCLQEVFLPTPFAHSDTQQQSAQWMVVVVVDS